MNKASSPSEVCDLYEQTAESYDQMMDVEIELPIYDEILGRLQQCIAHLPGALVDSSCGSGHMLQKYHESLDPDRSLVGIDLSPRMCEMATERLQGGATIVTGDMRDLASVETGGAAALISFFAIHHLDFGDVEKSLAEWHRVVMPGGQLRVATWEGSGSIDYGEQSDVVAWRYSEQQVREIIGATGFEVDRCAVKEVDDIPMDAIYVEATRS